MSRVVVVEDALINQRLLALLLGRLSHAAEVVSSAEGVSNADWVIGDVRLLTGQADALRARGCLRVIGLAHDPRAVGEFDAVLVRPLTLASLQAALEPTVSPVDFSVLDELRAAVGPEPVGQLVQLFLRDAPALTGAFKAALAANDLASATRAVHTLKSTSASLGARAFSDQCAGLERLTDLPALESHAPALTAALDAVLAALRSRVS